MSIKTMTSGFALAAIAFAGLAVEAQAGAHCAPGAARYSAARPAVSKVAVAKPAAVNPVKLAAAPGQQAIEGGNDAGGEKVAKVAVVKPAAPQQAAAVVTPATGDENSYTSVSAIAARLAALSSRRPAIASE